MCLIVSMLFVSKASTSVLSSVASSFRSLQTRGLDLILVLFLSAVTSFGQTYNWKNVVIKGGGFVSGLITHPNAPGVVYARTDIGGAYRWNAAGNSWIPLLDFGADANTYGIESVAIDPSASNRLYIAASRNTSSLKYILVSTNQGATFSSFTPPFSLDGNARGRGGGERMAVDPNLNSILFYGTKSQGLFQSHLVAGGQLPGHHHGQRRWDRVCAVRQEQRVARQRDAGDFRWSLPDRQQPLSKPRRRNQLVAGFQRRAGNANAASRRAGWVGEHVRHLQ
jgi:hypothetical protein